MDERGAAVVVEDDADIRTLLAGLLTQSGFEVHQTSNGTDGVRAVMEHDPVIVTVDLGLPDIDGFEVARRIRRVTDAYILMLTARTEEIDTLMGLDAGADDYITKPFRPRELRARIEAMLRRPRVQQSAGPAVNGELWSTSNAPLSSQAGHGMSAGAISAPGTAPSAAPTPYSAATASEAATRHEEISYRLDGLELFPNLYRVTVEGVDVQLTPTEFILLRTLLTSRRMVRSKAQLFRTLRDEEPDAGTFVSDADERTIEVHMGNLRRKLGDDPRRPRWVETLRGVGYRSAGLPQAGDQGL
ncbi:response regulator transcription factor [Tessaracoccus rhinocerotis]|uniref:Response regulator transcription factor n=1 Tax=Tessaracoccus rhinocerotis TaxID=1689449 RepID=A0A553JYZ5_9ACTN|nr:response regulator transcription factor [Tessaracoccus rhinocerotis]TRY17669.1 response regulator transcription factor [Tessaracoccus rhinocerotis]